MHKYFIKTPRWTRALFSSYIWRIATNEKVVYLTFDDGPHPTITPWVLDELKKYHAKATFFCIGSNVLQHRDTYRRILEEGHTVGNHTHHHLDGWKTGAAAYLQDVEKAAEVFSTNLFRPPYGKITGKQARGLAPAMKTAQVKVIMWDVLSADFDPSFSKEKCTQNVLRHVGPGSIVVFHDSVKAFHNLSHALPVVLEKLAGNGYRFERIEMGGL
jgi:peptidoglycan-N-acetylglucosamine deacetylase